LCLAYIDSGITPDLNGGKMESVPDADPSRPVSASAKPSIVLFAHGARDRGWAGTLSELRSRIAARAPGAEVVVAFLEFQAPTFADVFAAAAQAGSRSVLVVPVFWASGGHVANELPGLVAAAQRAHPEIAVRVLPVLSELPGLLDFVAGAVSRLARDDPA
jgi:sirohydrochlorin cobaltochelatase